MTDVSDLNQYSAWMFTPDHVETWTYWDDAFSKEECAQIITLGEGMDVKRAELLFAKDSLTEYRNSKVSWIQPRPETQWIYRRVTDIVSDLNSRFFKFDIYGIVDGFQFTRYDAPSGHYSAHIDRSIGIAPRKLSVTIQLSDPSEYEGGDLLLNAGGTPHVLPKAKGKMLVFPSYVVHEVTPVTKGTRYSLVCWVTGTPFR